MTPRRLLIAVLVLALGWSAWWSVAALNARRTLTQWLEARRADGWQAEWSGLSVTGFPNRIDRTISGLVLADPDSGWAWQAPFFQIIGLSYDTGHAILVWPPEQQIATPRQTLTVRGDSLRASLDLGAGGTVQTLTGVFDGLEIRSDAGWSMAADTLRLALRPTPGRSDWTDIGAEALGLRPPSALVAALSDRNLAPERFDRVHAELSVRFDRPPGLGVTQSRPQPQEIEIGQILLRWGELELTMTGDLSADPEGRAAGNLDLTARNWREVLRLAVEAGALTEPAADLLEGALGLFGASTTLELPLTFRDGSTLLGPIRIGEAPLLRLP